jgi:hypothetical protein
VVCSAEGANIDDALVQPRGRRASATRKTPCRDPRRSPGMESAHKQIRRSTSSPYESRTRPDDLLSRRWSSSRSRVGPDALLATVPLRHGGRIPTPTGHRNAPVKRLAEHHHNIASSATRTNRFTTAWART